MTDNIKSIIICYEDGNQITINHNIFSHLYIANINSSAEEIPYDKTPVNNTLYANLFIIKINKKINEVYHDNILEQMNGKKDITEIKVVFKTNKFLTFYLASDAEPFKNLYINNYAKSYMTNEDLCLLVSQYNIKYKNYLFI